MQVERTNSDALVVNKLPDGSTVIVDGKNETVFALNATAGAAWDACGDATTLSGVTERMRRSLDPEITEQLAEQAILKLQEQNLVTISGSQPTRRQFMATLGAAVALPLVVSLPVAEQRAYAQQAGSKGTATPPSSTPPSNGGHSLLWWILHLLGLV